MGLGQPDDGDLSDGENLPRRPNCFKTELLTPFAEGGNSSKGQEAAFLTFSLADANLLRDFANDPEQCDWTLLRTVQGLSNLIRENIDHLLDCPACSMRFRGVLRVYCQPLDGDAMADEFKQVPEL